MKKSVSNHSSKSSGRHQEIDQELERKAKRSRIIIEDVSHWDCPLCTYRNRNESFKCEMCNVRKGTSTRKPRLTQVTQQFAKIENQIEQERKKETRRQQTRLLKSKRFSSSSSSSNNKFANASTLSITVKGVTVFIHDIELTSSNEQDLINPKLKNKSIDNDDDDESDESDQEEEDLEENRKSTSKKAKKSENNSKTHNNSFESSSSTASPDNSSISSSSVSLKKKTRSKTLLQDTLKNKKKNSNKNEQDDKTDKDSSNLDEKSSPPAQDASLNKENHLDSNVTSKSIVNGIVKRLSMDTSSAEKSSTMT